MASSSTAALHLLRRATYGPTPASLAEVTKLGTDAWLKRQLAPASIPDARCDAVLRRFPELGWSIPTATARNDTSWQLMFKLVEATIARAVWSERQLHEVMTDFWSNHLNVTCPSSDVASTRHDYDTVIRKHALGSFSDLLVATALHPAMLRYLDNASSTRWHPNENQGRELMELHTVGVGAGYTETDVKNSALVLTGQTIDWETGAAAYRKDWHHTGPVAVLGFSHPNPTAEGGTDVARAYLRYLARHPATAQRIARKLAVRFVADAPPAALVDRLAATYLRNDTAIAPVLLQLFGSSEFAASAGGKLRRPYESVVASVRVLGHGPDASGTKGLEALMWITSDMGNAPLGWGPPNGYPDEAGAWQSAAGTLARWTSNMDLVAGWWPSTLTRPKLTSLLPSPLPTTHGALVDALSRRLLFAPAPAATQKAICAFLGQAPPNRLSRSSAAVGWRLPYIAALLLDSPAHATR